MLFLLVNIIICERGRLSLMRREVLITVLWSDICDQIQKAKPKLTCFRVNGSLRKLHGNYLCGDENSRDQEA